MSLKQFNKSVRKESKLMQTKKQYIIINNCFFVCINFDFPRLYNARQSYMDF